MRGRAPAALRQPRLRRQHAGPGRRVGHGRGVRARGTAASTAGPARSRRSRPRPTSTRATWSRASSAPRARASSSCATRPRRSTCSRPRCRPGTKVLSTPVEHHANMLPWRRHDLRMLPFTTSADELLEVAERELELGAIDLLAVTGASNVTGEVWPLQELAALAHAHGAQLFVDAAQLAPHRAIDMTRRRDRPPRALRPQALRAVRRRRAREPPCRWTASRSCTAAARSSSSRSTTSSGPTRPIATRPAHRT